MTRMQAAWSHLGGIATLILATLGAQQSAWAVLRAYEGFDYPNDGPAIHGLNGGTGWIEGWNDADGDFTILSNDGVSLANPQFPFATLGDRLEGGPANTASEVNRLLPEPFDMTQDGMTLYASLLFKKSQGAGTTGNNVEFVFYASNGSIQVARLGGTSGDRFFLHDAANFLTHDSVPVDVALDHTYFLVLKIVSSATANDQFYANVYDGTVAVPTEEPTTWDAEWGVNSARLIDNVRLVRGPNAVGAFDEIRIGTSYADVAVAGDAPALTADFNGDLVVDGNDFLIWQRNYLATGDVAGDANEDGMVDDLDLGEWKAQFGSSAAVTAAAVPEPASAALAIAALAFGAATKRQSLRRTSATKRSR